MKDVCQAGGHEPVIMEETEQAGDLLKQITGNIESCPHIITEMSFRSFNVAYELGIAHHEKGVEKVCLLRAKVPDMPNVVYQK